MRKFFIALCAIATLVSFLVSNNVQAQNSEAIRNYNKGVEASQNGNYNLAVTMFSIALGHDIQFKYAFYNRGWANYHLGYYGKAIEDFDATIRLDENYALAYNNRGLCYDKLEKLVKERKWMSHRPSAMFGKKERKPSPNFDK